MMATIRRAVPRLADFMPSSTSRITATFGPAIF